MNTSQITSYFAIRSAHKLVFKTIPGPTIPMTEHVESTYVESHLTQRMLVAVTLSILLHLLLLGYTQQDNITQTNPIEVTLLKFPQAKKQIVPTSQMEEINNPDAVQVSDKATKVTEEKMRRGDVSPQSRATSPTQQQKVKRAPQETKTSKQQVAQKSQALILKDDSLLGQFSQSTQSKTAPGRREKRLTDKQRATSFLNQQPFQQSQQSLMRQGNLDLLPDVRDGDVTLLNAKADRHAVFVRRVALQVFGILRSLNWQNLSPQQIYSLQQHSVVEAVMDPSGKLLSVKLNSQSGSAAFDEIVQRAANKGTWDQNPPPSARAADGNIHFIFYARSWTRTYGEQLREQRWLMLGTGLL